MTEKENFDDLIRQKLSEEEFPFDEKNWEKAAGMIDASRGPVKSRAGYFIFSALLIVSLCVIIPVMYNNSNDNLADNTIANQTTTNSVSNTNNPKPEINNSEPTSVATNFDNQDAKPNSETNNTSITSNENTTTNETVTKQEPRQPKKETQGNTNSTPAADGSKIVATDKTQNVIKSPKIVKKSTPNSAIAITKTSNGNGKVDITKKNVSEKPKGTDVANNVATRNAEWQMKKKSGNEIKSSNNKAAADKAANDKAEADKLAAQKAADEKAAAEKAEKDKADADKLALQKAADEKAIAEKLEAEKIVADKLAADKAAEEKAATDKLAVEKAAADKLAAEKAAEDKKKEDAKNTPPSKNVLWAEAGADYLLGWTSSGIKDANGFNLIGGLNFTHLFTNKFGISIGAQYNSISNIKNCVYTAQKTTYDFGDVRDVTTVSTEKLHYLVAPIKFHFVINNNNSFGAGVNVAYLINSRSSVETYTQKLNTKSNSKVETSKGYYNGFASPDVQLSLFYKRRIYKGFGVNTEFLYGLSDIKNDAFFGSAEAKQKNIGFKLTLTYDIFSK